MISAKIKMIESETSNFATWLLLHDEHKVIHVIFVKELVWSDIRIQKFCDMIFIYIIFSRFNVSRLNNYLDTNTEI